MTDTVSTQDLLPTMQEKPEPSCVSMRSNQSIEQPVNLKNKGTYEHSRIQQARSESSEPSCVSGRSNQSIEQPVNMKDSVLQQDRSESQEPSCVSMRSNQSIEQPVNLKDSSEHSNGSQLVKVLETFKSNMMKKFLCLSEGISKQGNPTLLNKIYTELYITEGESGEISNEHEVRQIETAFRRAVPEETPIKCNDIFKPLPEQDKPIRSVMTKGVAGIGKTVSVQKFILDWAEGIANQDVHLIFPLPFRELNLMKDKKLSLLDLLHTFFSETKEIDLSSKKVFFIFDGLDECRLPLDFHSSVKLCDVNESASVDVMLTNLIKGNLLPSAFIWITSRPATADLIPSECVDRVTEVRGFSDPQKEEYFSKRISDESLSNRIISHLKSFRSLYIMCHIPVFCWISATVLERMMSEAESEEIPKTLTQMYTHFLIIQTNIKHHKDYEKKVTDEDIIFKLGKLAFEQLVKCNLIFYEEDLRECGIDVAEASVYSGLCTQIFREEFGLYQGKVYCFVHLSIQEHLAALYVHLTLMYKSVNAFTQITKPSVLNLIKYISLKHSLYNLHQRAVDEALKSKNGHLDLFLRFLLGLSVESNHSLLQSVMRQMGKERYGHCNKETVDYIKQKIRKNPSPEKSINLFYCLNELGYLSLVEEIKHYLKSGEVKKKKLSSSQWSALVFVLLTSEQKMDVFKLHEFVGSQNNSDEVLLKLMPVVKTSKAVHLWNCGITDEGCADLASALRSNPSHMRELQLTRNKLGDSGVKHLSCVLKNCKLQKLSLVDCGITNEGCAALASALKSNPSHMRELNLNWNILRNSGVKLLSAVLADPQCKLKRLGLNNCGITGKTVCAALASALRSNPSHIRELYLSENKLEDSGVKLLFAVLENPQVKLEKIGLNNCGISDEGCVALTSALKSNPSHLRELQMTLNKLQHSGMKLLLSLLENDHCNMEKLRLGSCEITDEGCAALALAPRSTPSNLTELDLSCNKLEVSLVKPLCVFMENSYCRLEKLRLNQCGIEDEGCAALACVLRSSTSLLNLNLSHNRLGNSGVKLLTAGLENPQCKLKTLILVGCNIKDEGCAALASALRSNPSHLKELNLNENRFGDSGVKLLCTALENPHCQLEVLWLSNCDVTDKGCDALAAALKSNPSYLRELDLFRNGLGYPRMNLLTDLKNSSDYNLDSLTFWIDDSE